MLKQVTVAGRQIELHSVDGKVWCSRIADAIGVKRKQEQIDKELKTMNGNIYISSLYNNYGYDPEDYYLVRLR